MRVVAADLRKAFVAEVEIAFTHHADADRQAIQNPAQPFFAGAQRLFHLLAFADIDHDRDVVHRPSIAVRDRRDGHVDPDGFAILAQIALFHAHGGQLADDHATQTIPAHLGIVGMGQVLKALAFDFHDLVAQHVGEGLVGALDLEGVASHLDDAHRRLAEQRAKALLAGQQRRIDVVGMTERLCPAQTQQNHQRREQRGEQHARPCHQRGQIALQRRQQRRRVLEVQSPDAATQMHILLQAHTMGVQGRRGHIHRRRRFQRHQQAIRIELAHVAHVQREVLPVPFRPDAVEHLAHVHGHIDRADEGGIAALRLARPKHRHAHDHARRIAAHGLDQRKRRGNRHVPGSPGTHHGLHVDGLGMHLQPFDGLVALVRPQVLDHVVLGPEIGGLEIEVAGRMPGDGRLTARALEEILAVGTGHMAGERHPERARMTTAQLHVARELLEIAALQLRIELEHALQPAQHVHIRLESALHRLGIGIHLLLEAHLRHVRGRIVLMLPKRIAAEQAQHGNRQAWYPEPERETRRRELGHQ